MPKPPQHHAQLLVALLSREDKRPTGSALAEARRMLRDGDAGPFEAELRATFERALEQALKAPKPPTSTIQVAAAYARDYGRPGPDGTPRRANDRFGGDALAAAISAELEHRPEKYDHLPFVTSGPARNGPYRDAKEAWHRSRNEESRDAFARMIRQAIAGPFNGVPTTEP